MFLKQSTKTGMKDYTVSTLQQARDIVGLMSIAYTHAVAYSNASKGNIPFSVALETVMDQHEIHGIMKEMLEDFGDSIFTVVRDDRSEWIMDPEFRNL